MTSCPTDDGRSIRLIRHVLDFGRRVARALGENEADADRLFVTLRNIDRAVRYLEAVKPPEVHP